MTLSRSALSLFALAAVLAACTPAGETAPTTQPSPAAKAPPTAPGTTDPAQEPVSATVPAAFLGEWNIEPADCGTSRNDSRLVIERDRIAWWESSGPVTALTVHGPRDIAVTAELSGEGEIWSSTTRFVLRRNATLAATDSSGGTLVRHRCTISVS